MFHNVLCNAVQILDQIAQVVLCLGWQFFVAKSQRDRGGVGGGERRLSAEETLPDSQRIEGELLRFVQTTAGRRGAHERVQRGVDVVQNGLDGVEFVQNAQLRVVEFVAVARVVGDSAVVCRL